MASFLAPTERTATLRGGRVLGLPRLRSGQAIQESSSLPQRPHHRPHFRERVHRTRGFLGFRLAHPPRQTEIQHLDTFRSPRRPRRYPAAWCGRLSQRHGVGDYLFPNPRPESLLGHDVHLCTEQLLQRCQQATQIEEAAARFQVDQEVDIAALVVLTAPPSRTPLHFGLHTWPPAAGSHPFLRSGALGAS